MKKMFSRREFLKSAAIAAVGVLASAVKVERQRPTEATQHISRGQDSIDLGIVYSQNGQLSRDCISKAHKRLEDRDIQAGKRMMESYVAGFDLARIAEWAWSVNEDGIVILSTDSGVTWQEYQPGCIFRHYKLNDQEEFIWYDRSINVGSDSELEDIDYDQFTLDVDFRIEPGQSYPDRLIGKCGSEEV